MLNKIYTPFSGCHWQARPQPQRIAVTNLSSEIAEITGPIVEKPIPRPTETAGSKLGTELLSRASFRLAIQSQPANARVACGLGWVKTAGGGEAAPQRNRRTTPSMTSRAARGKSPRLFLDAVKEAPVLIFFLSLIYGVLRTS